jgi:MFS family permease
MPPRQHTPEPQQDAETARPLMLLMLAMFWMQSTQSISTQSNAAFAAGIYGADNVAEIAAFCGQLVGAGAFVEFLANPTCGGLCDRFGRRPCLLLCALIQTAGRVVQCLHPTVTTFRICRPIAGCAVQVFFTALRASVADLVEGAERTSVMGKMYSAQMGSFMVCGLLAGRVTARWGFKGGFVGSAIASSVAFIVLLAGRMPETLPAEKVRPLTTVSPLSFLALFNPNGIYSGRRRGAAGDGAGDDGAGGKGGGGGGGVPVGRLAAVLALQKGTQIPAITEARTQFLLSLGWNPIQRANYLTTVGVTGMLSYRLQGYAVKSLGPRIATTLGNLCQAMVMIGTGLSKTATGVYASLIPGIPFAAEAAVETALSAHADRVGVGQGKLNADTGNLIALMKAIMPVLYAKLLGWGLQHKLPGAAFFFTGGCYLAAELLVSTIDMKPLLE